MRHLPYIVELIVFFACAGFYTIHTIESEFIYQVVSEKYNFTSNHSVNYCENNHTEAASEQIIADEVSRWTMYTKIVTHVSNSISALIITTWSDRIGRQRAMLFPLLGCFISTTVQAFIILYRLPLYFVVINGLTYGGLGGYSALVDVSTAYLSDTVKQEDRGKRFTILELFAQIGGGLALIGTGYWIKYQGFVPASFFLSGCSLTALILLPFIENTKPPKKRHKKALNESATLQERETLETSDSESKTKSTIWDQVKEVKRIYSSNYSKCNECTGDNLLSCTHGGGKRKGRVWRLWHYVAAYTIYLFVMDGIDVFQTMFFVSSPICFTPELVGAQNGIDASTIIFSPLLVTFYESILHLDSQTIVLTAISGRLATSLLMFFAKGTAMVFIATSIGIFSCLTTPYIRLKLSFLVSTSEQGPAFAMLSCINGILSAFSPVFFLTVYPATLHISNGFSWLVTASILCIPLALMIIVWFANKSTKDTSPKVKEETCQKMIERQTCEDVEITSTAFT